MATVLQEKDAAEWTYRGEGAENVILAYNGKSPNFVGKVLRIQKVQNGCERENGHTVLTNHECLLWWEFNGIVSAPTKDIADQLYVQNVICPLLGSKYVDVGIRILVSREFLEAVGRNIRHQRPSWRIDAAKINPLCDSVLLIADHSMFPHGTSKADFCISVEIKPKSGFLPTSEYIAEENAIKKRITRFRMHQALKCDQKKISQLSKYDPLDMFSGSKERVQRAIQSLMLTPQNNFRVFLNGSLLFGVMGAASMNCTDHQQFQDGIKHFIRAEDGMQIKYFMELLAETVFKSGLLNRLLKLQKLDALDIEGAIHAYYDIVSKPCVVCQEKGGNKLSSKYIELHSMAMDEKLEIVRNYLISATAKDVSMMFTFRSRESTDMESPDNSIFLESTNQAFGYKASFIDLDMKPLKKMEHYYKLDQQIVRHYLQLVKDKEVIDSIEGIEESSNSCMQKI